MPKAKNLKYIRREKNLTQQGFADAIGVSRATIIAWETKKRAIPMPSAKKIAAFFGVDYADFCDIDLESVSQISEHEPPTQHEFQQLIRFRKLSEESKNIFRAALDAAYKIDAKEE